MKIIIFYLFLCVSISAEINIYQNEVDDVFLNQVIFDLVSDQDAYGIQFDLYFDENNILVTPDHLVSALPGIQVWSKSIEDGHIKVLMFSLSYDKIANSKNLEPNDFLKLSFSPISGFLGNSSIEIANIVLAGASGREIEVQFSPEIPFIIIEPTSSYLGMNFPNPFKLNTKIPYTISNPGLTKINVFNDQGLLVSSLVEEFIERGYYLTSWDGKDALGQALESGRYTVVMCIENSSEEKSIIVNLLK